MTADPGELRGAVERTRLSWRRTTLTASTVVLVAVVRLIVLRRNDPATRTESAIGIPAAAVPAVAKVAAALIGAAWVGILLLARHRRRQLGREDSVPPRRVPAAIGLLAFSTAVLGVLIIR